MEGPGEGRSPVPPFVRAVFWGLLLALLLGHVASLFTENINWDEFALLERAERTSRTGELIGGGRPGLATLILVPFAEECVNAVEALVRARVLWTFVVVGAVLGFWFLLRGFLADRERAWHAAALGLGLWILAPDFLRYSIQVRTDQIALLMGLWGGVALLASRRRTAWAAVAGLLMGVGFLSSQKLAYVGALAGVLVVGDLLVRRDIRARREAIRAGLAGAGFLLVVLGYRQILDWTMGAPTLLPISGQLNTFDYYREFVGYGHYIASLWTLIPHLLILISLPIVSMAWLRDRHPDGPQLIVAWAVFLLGGAVLLFHAGRFPYFYMTLGLFPATLGALLLGPLVHRLRSAIGRRTALAVFWTPLVLLALAQTASLLRNSQNIQRTSLEFVQRVFPADARGFAARGALACRHDPDPIPVMVNETLIARFGGVDGEQPARAFLDEFRNRPVSFMILPDLTWFYPEVIRTFWNTRYVRYHGAVAVPGREIDASPGWRGTFEAVVAGEYVWRPESDSEERLEVDGRLLAPGESVRLQAGLHDLHLPEGGSGLFVLDLPEPPAPDPTPFYRLF